jgi:thiamine pyrophosphate-dependent acetolactate synthase large subunit-like protein
MKRAVAIDLVFRHVLDDHVVVCANGMIGREAYTARDREGNFYMIGSMGLASSIGLGIAHSRPEKKVVVLDGDGNVLMAMGTLAQVAHLAPKNYVHLCLDTETYDSTGGQRSISDKVDLAAVARAAGYVRTATVRDEEALERIVPELFAAPGPSLLLIKVETGNVPGIARVRHTPLAITERFSTACRS